MRVVEDVARILAPRIFTLDEETPLGMGKDVMVVSPKGVTVREDEDVEVVGMVREFTWTELEKEKFDFDLKREWQTEFKSRPVIYATSVRQAKTVLTARVRPAARCTSLVRRAATCSGEPLGLHHLLDDLPALDAHVVHLGRVTRRRRPA